MVVALATSGCATKKYARQQAGAVDQRVSEVDKKHTEAIANLEGKEQKDISRVEERAMSAENKANDAARAAQAADQRAAQAGESAKNATDLAQQAQSRIGDVQHVVENIDKYKLVSSQDVLFGFDKAALTPEGQSKLDSLLQSAQGMGHYLVEVEGYTDRTGPRDYNLALSRRRADTVVRYMVDHGVPLRRIHMIGLGYESQPAASGQAAASGTQMAAAQPDTKMSRKEMRRVVINIYTPEATLSASSGAPSTTTDTNPPATPR
jgi:outer membrane protein OmpA-like peptidoglycan-associated protein